MPDPREAVPVPETSFQHMVDVEYSQVDRSKSDEWPNGLFGIQPGSSSFFPKWTMDELLKSLSNEDPTMTGNNRAKWKEDAFQRTSIILNTLYAYAAVLGKLKQMQFQNEPQEWTDAMSRVTA